MYAVSRQADFEQRSSVQWAGVPGHSHEAVQNPDSILSDARMHVLIGDPFSHRAHKSSSLLSKVEVYIPAYPTLAIRPDLDLCGNG